MLGQTPHGRFKQSTGSHAGKCPPQQLPTWQRNEWHSRPSMEFSPRCPYLKGVQDQLRKYFLQQGEGPCNSSVVCLCWSFSLGSHIRRRFWALLMHPRPPLEAYFLIHCTKNQWSFLQYGGDPVSYLLINVLAPIFWESPPSVRTMEKR